MPVVLLIIYEHPNLHVITNSEKGQNLKEYGRVWRDKREGRNVIII